MRQLAVSTLRKCECCQHLFEPMAAAKFCNPCRLYVLDLKKQISNLKGQRNRLRKLWYGSKDGRMKSDVLC